MNHLKLRRRALKLKESVYVQNPLYYILVTSVQYQMVNSELQHFHT